MMTGVPTSPLPGLKLEMLGAAVTVKVFALDAIAPPRVTEILPVVAPEGTATLSCVAVTALTLATVLLNFTTLLAKFAVSKFVPVTVTAVPTGPFGGEKPVTVGAGMTV